MVLFLTFALAATVVSPPFENKSSAEEVFSKCEALLGEWEGEHPIYMSRYLVSGQGYRYRITIDISTQFSQEQLSQLSESKCIKIEDMTLTAQTDTNTKVISKRDQTEDKESIS